MSDQPPNREGGYAGFEQALGTAHGPVYDGMAISGQSFTAAGVWPTANTAIFIPVLFETPVVVTKFSFNVSVASGNFDIGLFDEFGIPEVRLGSTAVPAAGVGIADVADTPVNPGQYWIGMVVNNITASFNRAAGFAAQVQRAIGVYSMASAFPLPNPVTYSNWASLYVPMVNVHTVAVV